MSVKLIDMHVPSFGQGLEEALLSDWVAEVGAHIARGDVVAMVETDKATVEIVAQREGRIAAHAIAPGTIVKSGDVLYQLAVD